MLNQNFHFHFVTLKPKRNKQINLPQKNLSLKNFKTKKGQANKSAPEN